MPKEVYIDDSAQVIVVKAWGEVTAEDIYATKDAVRALSEEAGLTLVLADASERTKAPSVFTYYRLARIIADDPVLRHVKLAYLPSASTLRESRFFATTASNRGIDVRLFQARQEALGWLTGSTGSG